MSDDVVDLSARRALPSVMAGIEGFLRDPPDSDFQRGYLAALLVVYREDLRGGDDARAQAAERLLASQETRQ